MRLLRGLALLLCVSTLAFAASSCGSSGGTTYSGTKPNTWAATVCGAIGGWAQGLEADSARLGASVVGNKDLKVVRAKFVAFLEKAVRSSRVMVTRIGSTGAPAVKDGAAIEQELVSGLEGAQTSFTRAIAKAKRLPTTDLEAFGTAVQALGVEVSKELTAVGEKFNALGEKYQDMSLKKATSSEPACAKIAG